MPHSASVMTSSSVLKVVLHEKMIPQFHEHKVIVLGTSHGEHNWKRRATSDLRNCDHSIHTHTTTRLPTQTNHTYKKQIQATPVQEIRFAYTQRRLEQAKYVPAPRKPLSIVTGVGVRAMAK
jgi:hypothetical protein